MQTSTFLNPVSVAVVKDPPTVLSALLRPCQIAVASAQAHYASKFSLFAASGHPIPAGGPRSPQQEQVFMPSRSYHEFYFVVWPASQKSFNHTRHRCAELGESSTQPSMKTPALNSGTSNWCSESWEGLTPPQLSLSSCSRSLGRQDPQALGFPGLPWLRVTNPAAGGESKRPKAARTLRNRFLHVLGL